MITVRFEYYVTVLGEGAKKKTNSGLENSKSLEEQKVTKCLIQPRERESCRNTEHGKCNAATQNISKQPPL